MLIETQLHPLVPFHSSQNQLDSTKLQTYLACPRKFFFEYLLGWKLDMPSNHLAFGGAWHVAMEHILRFGYGADSVKAAAIEAIDYYRKTHGPETDSEFGAKTPAALVNGLVAYTNFWHNRDLDYEVHNDWTEITGTVPINDEGDSLVFRIDAIMREKANNDIFVREHKTAGWVTTTWTKQWPLSVQVGTYTHTLHSILPSERIKGVEINVFEIKKPTKTADGINFMRIPIQRDGISQQRWLDTVQLAVIDLKTDIARLVDAKADAPTMRAFPQRPTSCTNYGGCPFIDLCDAWGNPLANCHQPPPGFKQEFWEPLELDRSRHFFKL